MEYLNVIKSALIAYPAILMLALIPFIIYEIKERKILELLDIVAYSMFVLYLTCAFFLVILPLPENPQVFQISELTKHIQWMPFMFIRDILKDLVIDWKAPLSYLNFFKQDASIQMAFNLIMFMPLGIFLKYWLGMDLKKVLCIGFLTSLFFEITQLTGLYGIFNPYRLFDIDDLMVNTSGALVGYHLANWFEVNVISFKAIAWHYFRSKKELIRN